MTDMRRIGCELVKSKTLALNSKIVKRFLCSVFTSLMRSLVTFHAFEFRQIHPIVSPVCFFSKSNESSSKIDTATMHEGISVLTIFFYYGDKFKSQSRS
jgi:hypothetical protein